jgi:hypothetical protein
MLSSKKQHVELNTTPELVAHIPHCFCRVVGAVSNVALKSSDMDVHRPAIPVVVVAPDSTEQGFPSDDPVPAACQKSQCFMPLKGQ